jgi:pimeloyl-ACP methyl ester carboxylesterase
MKLFKRIFRALLVSYLIISIVSSCKKEGRSDYQHFVSKEYVVTYKTDYINSILNIASATYPELNDLKPLISQSVDIYKVVYRTEIQGKEINASGLLCVPSGEGEYPLLCFQNGTNTVNAYAPSEYVLNPAYQFIEVIASMGYIIVIPDYPGFGESADIPHPYLIKEPTVKSIVDMLSAVKEMDTEELTGLTIKDAVYLIGYSQGGWATLLLHQAIEQDYSNEFNLKGSVCGAGPYDLNLLFGGMTGSSSYPMPVYIGYIINAYSAYDQFTNPVSDILKEPYASRLVNLYNGTLSSDQINSQLTTSIPDLFTAGFLSGFASEVKYSSVRASLTSNSIEAWKTEIPLFLIHGGGDTTVNPVTTESIYNGMIQAGTSTQTCRKEIIPDLDHGDAAVPAMIKGLKFIMSLQ